MNKKEKYKYKMKDSSGEENILYEVLVTNEWQEPEVVLKDDVIIRKTLGSVRSSSRWFRPLSFSPNVYVPNPIRKLVDLQMTWQFAIGECGKAVAILQENVLEIRTSKNDYSSITGKTTIQKDPFPQWRKVCWSGDCNLVAIAYSNGDLEFFDLVATKLFSITKTKGSLGCQVDCSHCVVDMSFVDYRIKKTRWSSELIVCNYKGELNSYYVNSTEKQEATTFSFTNRYPNGVTAFCCHLECQLLFVGGTRMENADEAQTHTSASLYEITAWRLLNDEPYYKLVTTLSDDKLMPSVSRSLLKYMPTMRFFQKMKQAAIFKLRISPNGKKLAVIHTSGSLSIWEIPSLRLYRLWHLGEQPGYNAVNTSSFDYSNKKKMNSIINEEIAFHLVDLNWWSDNALILGRCSGSVTISSILTLKNLLGASCEWFEPMPQLCAAYDKKFLTLECDTQINAKKRSSIDGESSDDESSILRKSTKLMKKALYYMTDSEKFQPPRKRTKILSKTYRLVCLKSTTPEELYKRKMDKEEYGEALALARAYGLDTDLVYQRQWKTATVSIASIQDYLSKIQKRSWVLHECLERVSDDIDAVRELLLYGMKGTELEILVKVGKGEDDGKFNASIPTNYDDDSTLDEICNLDESSQKMQKLLSQIDFNNLTLEQKQLLLSRRKLVSYLARLDTYEVILGGSQEAVEHFDAKFFQSFRTKSAVDATVEFARNGDWKRVRVMLTYHGDEVIEHWLSILSNFPETMNPYEYRNLLPECTPDNERVYAWEQLEDREQDWCQDVRCQNAVGDIHIETSLYENYPELSRFRSSKLNPVLLTDWYEERAREIEKRTYFVDCALELVKLGQEKNIRGLEELNEDLLTLETLVYEGQLECTLSEYQAMDDVAKAHLLMSTATEENYVKVFRQWLIPFLDRREARFKGRKLEIIRSYMLDIATSDLSRCLLVCQNSRIELTNAIITPVSEMVDIALSCVYNCTASDQLTVANCILECLPSRNFGPETATLLKLHDWIDEFESHLSAALIVNEYGVSATLKYIQKCQNDPEEVKQLLIKMTRFAGKKLAFKEQQWFKLLDNVLELQKILRCISPNLCHEIFISSLLCSNNAENILLTEKLMECTKTSSIGKKVDYETAVKLVLDAAREYFNSSSSLSDPCMDLAKSCLNLISDKPTEIEMELDLVAALTLLKELNVSVLPLQVRLCEDRIQLIEMALESKPKSYTFAWKLLKLADLLRVSGDDKHTRHGRVISLAANAALLKKDYNVCWELCQQLIDKDHHDQWQICEKLGTCEKYTNLHARRNLLSYSAIYCSSDSLEGLIRSHNLLELQSLNQQLHSEIDRDKMDSKADALWMKPLNQTRDFTQQMFRATGFVTKTVISQLVTNNLWNRNNDDLSSEEGEKLIDLSNVNFDRQGCSPFYCDVIENHHKSEFEADYGRFMIRPNLYPAIQMARNLLRAALLAESVAESLQACLDSTVLSKLAEYTLPEDCALGLSYLFAVKSVEDADSSLNSLTKSDVSLQLSCYYFALQVLFRVCRTKNINQNENYLLNPEVAIDLALDKTAEICETSNDQDLLLCVTLLKQHYDTLSDMLQGQLLHRLGRGVDVVRFSLDPQYKTNTILGLGMTLDDNVYETAVSLAARYDIPSFDVYVNHLQFLFTEIEPNEIEKRVNRLDLVPRLSKNPTELNDFLNRSVYPTISGLDYSRLLYYYQFLEKCGCANTILQSRIRLLKKIKNLTSELDFKLLIESDDPLSLIIPCLNKTNVHSFAKLANQLTSNEGPLIQSSIYCAWVQKMFYQIEDDQKIPDTSALWVHRYESCGEFVQKLNARDVYSVVKGLVFSRSALDYLPIDARKEIVKRVLKHSRQECNKVHEENEKTKWEKCIERLNAAKNHLEWRESEDVEIASGQLGLLKYIDRLDMTISVADKVLNVLKEFLMDGNSIVSLQQLVSICPIDTCVPPSDVVHEALRHLTDEIKNSNNDSTDLIPFKRIQKILSEIHRYLSEGGDLLLMDDIIGALRPFCSDPSVDIRLRLDILQELEKLFTLEGDDARLAILYRTQTILAAAWPDILVTTDDVSTEVCRRSLFDKLLSDCSSSADCVVVVRLLTSWPSLTWSNVEDDAWYRVLNRLLSCTDDDSVNSFVSIFRCWPSDVPVPNLECIERLVSHIPEHAPLVHRIKFLLLSGHKEMHERAIEHLNDHLNLTRDDFDDEIFNLLLVHGLTTKIVESLVFAGLVDYLLNNSDRHSIEDVSSELTASGYHFEAGSLLFRHRSTPRTLRNFRSAFQSLKSWLS